MQKYLKIFISSVLILSITTLFTACGGGGGGGEPPSDDKVAESLEGLGVDTSKTTRVDDKAQALPENYSPFGGARTFDQINELLIIGMVLDPGAFNTGNSQMTLVKETAGSLNQNLNQTYDTEVLFKPAPLETPWALSVGDAPDNLRAAARGDFDGDGLEEFAVIYRQTSEDSVQLQLYDDQGAGFTLIQSLTVANSSPLELAAEAADFNGDGNFELVVGLSFADSGQLIYLENDNGALKLAGTDKTLPQAFGGSELHLAMAVGNMDYDGPHELAVIVNETYFQPGDPSLLLGTSRYFVFDDAASGYAMVADDLVRNGSAAVVADVSIGDIDGDNLGELLFAGLTTFNPIVDCDYRYLLLARDDLAHDLELLGEDEFDSGLKEKCGFGTEPLKLRQVFINALDLDGDGLLEVQVNQFLFEDWMNSAPWTPVSGTPTPVIPVESLFLQNDGALTGTFDRHHSAVAVGDVTADKREDVIIYSQTGNSIEVWGIAEPDKEWDLQATIPINPTAAGQKNRPLLLPVNVDHDSFALQYDEGTYQLIFTEPVIIAALAAAPCANNLGQNEDTCRTSYGEGESSTVEREFALNVTAGVTVGFKVGAKVPIIDVGAEVETLVSVRVSAGFSTSNSYQLTKSTVYTGGPIEDTVIFTSIPYDIYSYTVKSHPDPTLIGETVVVSLPRSPVQLHVERSFYNNNIEHGGFKVDERVFQHANGQPHSYPSKSEKDALLTTFTGVETGPVSVGQTGGGTGLSIQIVTESGLGQSYGVETELEVQASAGWAIAGFSIGGGVEYNLQHSHGTELTYSGAVGDLPPENFTEHGYQWGLFTYIQEQGEDEQQFEVINYWVE